MSVDITSNKEFNYTANLDIEQVLQQSAILKDEFKSLGEELSNSFDAKSLTQYEAGLQNIKQAFLDLAKEKAEYEKADKAASMAIQSALKEERELIKQRNAELKNNAGETKNAKGLIEQKQAALVRLNKVYSNLNATEKNSAGGQRLQGITSSLTTQLKGQEAAASKAKGSVGKYTDGISKAFGALGSLANFLPGIDLADIFLLGYEGVMKLIEGLDVFNMKASDAKVTGKNLGAAMVQGDYASAIKNVNELTLNVDLAKKGLYDKTAVVKQYNETIGVTSGQVKTLDGVEKGIAANSENYIRMTLLKAAANLSLQEAAKKAVEAERRFLEDEEALKRTLNGPKFNDGEAKGLDTFAARGMANEAAHRKRVADKAVEQEKGIAKNFMKAAAEVANAMGGVLGQDLSTNTPSTASGDATVKAQKDLQQKLSDAAVKAQKDLQQKLNDAGEKGKRKELDADAQELADKKAFYDELRRLAKEHNDAVDKFNNDPKNKGLTKRIKVDPGVLNAGEAAERDAAIDKQASVKLKTTIAEQKALYDEFEDYKLKAGVENAKKLVGDKIDTEKTYLEYLKGLEEQLTKDPKSKSGDESKKEGQLKVLRESITAQESLVKKNYQDLLVSLMDYEQTRTVMIENYNRKRAELVANGDKQAVVVLDGLHKEALNSLDDQNVQKLKAYKALYQDIDKLSDQAIRTIIADGQKMLAGFLLTGKISKEEVEKLAKQIANTIENLDKRLPQNLINLGNELKNIGSIVGEVDAGFGEWLNTFGNIVSTIGDLRGKIEAIDKLPKGDILGQITGGIGIIGSVLSIGTAINKILNGKSEERDERQRQSYNVQIEQLNNLNKLLERQTELINKAYGVEKITKYSDALKTASKNQSDLVASLNGKYYVDNNSPSFRIIAERLNVGLKARDKVEQDFYDFVLRTGALKKFDFNKLSNEELNKMLDTGGFDDATASLVRNLIQARQAIIDLGNAAKEELTGTAFESFADGIVDALARGEDAAKNFEEAIRQSMINSLKTEAFKAELQKFYDDFAKAAENGLTKDEIDSLGAAYDAIIEKQKQRQADLEAVTGIKLKVDGSVKVDDSELAQSVESLGDSLFGLITKKAEETGKSIEEILKQSILDGLRAEVITNALKPLADKIKGLYANGKIPTKEEIEAATTEMNAFISKAKEQLEKIEKSTGLVFGEKLSEDLSAEAQKIKDEVKSVEDSILDIFANTDGALQNFEDKFNGMVKNTILQNLSKTTLEGKLTEFYTEFKKLSTVDDAKKQEQIALLRAQYNAIIKEGKDEYERLQDVFGVDYSTAKQDQSAISSSVGRSITEDTANVLAGTFVGIYDEVKKSSGWLGKIYSISMQNLDTAIRTEQNTRRTADNTEGVGAKLDQIIANTKKSTSTSLSDSYLKL